MDSFVYMIENVIYTTHLSNEEEKCNYYLAFKHRNYLPTYL